MEKSDQENKKISSIFLILSALISLIPPLVMIFLVHNNYVNVIFSDQWSVITRFQLLESGQLSMWHFLFDKQIDHNHFIVYFLSLWDLKFFKGTSVSLYVWNFIFTISSFGIYAHLFILAARRQLLSWKSALVLIPLTSLFIFNPIAQEVWFLGFQVVVPGALFFILASLYFSVLYFLVSDI